MVIQFHDYHRRKDGYRSSSNGVEQRTPGRGALASEFIGTLIFSLIATAAAIMTTGAGGRGEASLLISAPALALFALVLALGGVSGAHFNPIITLAFALRRQLVWDAVAKYLTVQLLGAIAGAYLALVAFDDAPLRQVLSGSAPLFRSFFLEAFFAFTLVLVALNSARCFKLAGHNAALAVGTTVWAGALIVAPISGGWFNPVLALGMSLASGEMSGLMPRVIAPILGALFAIAFSMLLPAPQREHRHELAQEHKPAPGIRTSGGNGGNQKSGRD